MPSSWKLVVDGTVVSSGSITLSYDVASGGTKQIDTYASRTAGKKTYAQTMSLQLTFSDGYIYNDNKINGTWTWTYSIPALASYTIKYDANGGSGAPGNQTKWYGSTLTLSTTTPNRTGYTFKGWATSASGAVAYGAGGAYTANAGATLYAVWQAWTYTVSYNANGGSGAPGNQTKTYGVTLTLSTTKPTRTNYNFKGWATSSGGSVAYVAGGSYTSNVTLYAVWELAWVKPRITNLSASRCNSSGTVADDGTYAKVAFSWACDKTVSSIKIEYKTSSATSWTSTTVSASGTSGTVSTIIGGGGLGTEYIYNVRVTVADSVGSASATTDVPAMSYVMDFKAGGTGAAFGKPATENALDSAWPVIGRNGATFYSWMTLTHPPYIAASALTDDFNNYVTKGKYIQSRDSSMTSILNRPTNQAGVLYCIFPIDAGGTVLTGSGWKYMLQIFITYTGLIYLRSANSNSETVNWGSWRELLGTGHMPAYVTSQGISGKWRYRKWANGNLEAWTSQSITTDVTTAWGNVYVSPSLSEMNLPFPVTFTNVTYLGMSLSPNLAGAWLIVPGGGSIKNTETGPIQICRGTSGAGGTYRINYYVLGQVEK